MIIYEKGISEPELKYGMGYPVGIEKERLASSIEIMSSHLFREFKNEELVLVCRGSSGAIIAGALMVHSNLNVKEIFHVKKKGEESHSGYRHFHPLPRQRIIIVDDFISTGDTIFAIYKKLIEDEPIVATEGVDCICVSGDVPYIDETIITKILICGRLPVAPLL